MRWWMRRKEILGELMIQRRGSLRRRLINGDTKEYSGVEE